MTRLSKSIGSVLFISLFCPVFVLAEDITITTYYPSPYGSYQELRSKRIAIGDNYINSASYTWEAADGDGGEVDYLADLIVEGNVGIGTANPVAKLDINGGSSSSIIPLQLTQTNSNSEIINVKNLSGNDMFKLTLQNINNVPTFYDYNSGSGLASISLRAGNVGIGTIAPGAKLEVAANTAIKLGNAFFSSGGDYVHIANNEWYNGSAWTATAAGVLFQISGVGATMFGHTAAGVHTAWAGITSTAGWIASSSQIYKQNIKPLTDMDYVLLRQQFRNLNIYSYNRIDLPKEKEVGFIAEYSPDLIANPDKTGIPLIKAIGYLAAIAKGQDIALDSLQKKVNELSGKIKQQQKVINKLSKKL